MPYNGSGQFNRIYSWEADKAAGIDITASRMDADTNDITASGLSAVLTRDGQGHPTANLPMNNFHHTGALAATSAGQYLTYEQLVGAGTLALMGNSLALSGNATIGGSQTITGNETISGTLNVTGGVGFSAFLNVLGAASFSSTMNVVGGVGFSSFLNLGGAAAFSSTLNVTGGVGLSSFLNVSGTTNLSGVLNCTGTTSISNTGPFMIASGGTFTPSAWTAVCNINCANGIAATGYLTVSDQRMKSAIEDITAADGEDWVMRGRPRTYVMDGKPSAGFVAQEDIAAGRHAAVLSIADDRPEFASATEFSAPGQRLIRDYLHDIAYLTAALKSALSRIAALEKG